MSGTLHSAVAIRQSNGQISSLIYRIGRQFNGAADIFQDLLQSTASVEARAVLVVGRVGVGCSSLLRDIARAYTEYIGRRVSVIDTHGELLGGGLCAHPSVVPRARRFLVPNPESQDVTIAEAVRNHRPQVLVIDDIASEKDVAAVKYAMQCGVSVFCGTQACNIRAVLLNPALRAAMGVEDIPVSKREGPDGPIQHRCRQPLFDAIIEVQWHGKFLVHRMAAAAIDSVCEGRPVASEARWFDRGTLAMKARFAETILGKF
jgi:stage III sporulation protein SpoIIIAA